MNHIFEGVQASDSKDFIIFLLEQMNNELVKIHNIKHKIQEEKKDVDQMKNPTCNNDINAVLKYFLVNFKKNYCSTIGDNLFGFNITQSLCNTCNMLNYNFNMYNLLIFYLEGTSDFYKLSYNNAYIPTITFYHCFEYLRRVSWFTNSYCVNCNRNDVTLRQEERVYSLPKYFIIILNRGKDNIFQCNVEVQEEIDLSPYVVQKSDNDIYELTGIVSHLGESSMSGHFVAYCKHNIDGKWRLFNDAIVSDMDNCNSCLSVGIPYILFYKKKGL